MFEIIAEIVLEIVGEMLVTLGSEGVAHSTREERRTSPLVAGFVYFLCGSLLGALSLWLVPERLLPSPRYPGISLVLGPLVTGTVMKLYGDHRRQRGRRVTHLATFWGGAIFAFSIALIRFLAV